MVAHDSPLRNATTRLPEVMSCKRSNERRTESLCDEARPVGAVEKTLGHLSDLHLLRRCICVPQASDACCGERGVHVGGDGPESVREPSVGDHLMRQCRTMLFACLRKVSNE